jgi:aromatic ring-cleaving dioxygenase
MRRSPTAPDRALDIVDLLTEDHIALRSLADPVGGRDDSDGSAYLAWSDRLVRHEVAEELVVYPALLSFDGGSAVADSRLEDQSDIERQLVALGQEAPGTPGFHAAAARLVLGHLAHIDREDSQVLPILATRVSRRRRMELGRRFRGVQQVAPMRRLPEGIRIPAGRTVVDRTSALSVWMRDVATASGLAG